MPITPLARRLRSLAPPAWNGTLRAEPMLAFARAEPFDGDGWLFEHKLDGFRMLAAKDGDRVSLRYRSGHDATELFPEIVAAVRALRADRLLLDGELVVLDALGRPSFEALQQRAFQRRVLPGRNAAGFHPFDVLAADGHDVRPLSLRDRKGLLATLCAKSAITPVGFVEGHGVQLFAEARKRGLEGIVCKAASGRYESGRSASWLKVKVRHAARFVAVGLSDPSADTFGMHSLHLAEREASGLRYVGRVGLPGAEAEAVRTVLSELRVARPAVETRARARTWLRPAVECEVRFMARTESGKLREPVFLRFVAPG